MKCFFIICTILTYFSLIASSSFNRKNKKKSSFLKSETKSTPFQTIFSLFPSLNYSNTPIDYNSNLIESDFDNLTSWALNQTNFNVSVIEGLRMKILDIDSRYIYTETFIPNNTIIMSIPLNLTIGYNSSNSPFIQNLTDNLNQRQGFDDAKSKKIAVAIFLFNELKNPFSFFQNYLKFFYKNLNDSPLLYNDKLVNKLKDSYMSIIINEALTNLTQEYDLITKQRDIMKSVKIKADEYIKLRILIEMKQKQLNDFTFLIIPIFDSFNISPLYGNVFIQYNEFNNTINLISFREIQTNEEILLQIPNISNHQLLLKYGFTINENKIKDPKMLNLPLLSEEMQIKYNLRTNETFRSDFTDSKNISILIDKYNQIAGNSSKLQAVNNPDVEMRGVQLLKENMMSLLRRFKTSFAADFGLLKDSKTDFDLWNVVKVLIEEKEQYWNIVKICELIQGRIGVRVSYNNGTIVVIGLNNQTNDGSWSVNGGNNQQSNGIILNKGSSSSNTNANMKDNETLANNNSNRNNNNNAINNNQGQSINTSAYNNSNNPNQLQQNQNNSNMNPQIKYPTMSPPTHKRRPRLQ